MCIDDLLHIPQSLWQTYGSMECICMYVQTYICSNMRMETESNVGSVYNASKFVVPGLVLLSCSLTIHSWIVMGFWYIMYIDYLAHNTVCRTQELTWDFFQIRMTDAKIWFVPGLNQCSLDDMPFICIIQ
jgi:hypothetical protein